MDTTSHDKIKNQAKKLYKKIIIKLPLNKNLENDNQNFAIP